MYIIIFLTFISSFTSSWDGFCDFVYYRFISVEKQTSLSHTGNLFCNIFYILTHHIFELWTPITWNYICVASACLNTSTFVLVRFYLDLLNFISFSKRLHISVGCTENNKPCILANCSPVTYDGDQEMATSNFGNATKGAIYQKSLACSATEVTHTARVSFIFTTRMCIRAVHVCAGLPSR
jgi:hypothetical protein